MKTLNALVTNTAKRIIAESCPLAALSFAAGAFLADAPALVLGAVFFLAPLPLPFVVFAIYVTSELKIEVKNRNISIYCITKRKIYQQIVIIK